MFPWLLSTFNHRALYCPRFFVIEFDEQLPSDPRISLAPIRFAAISPPIWKTIELPPSSDSGSAVL